jgi:hypothetical protein
MSKGGPPPKRQSMKNRTTQAGKASEALRQKKPKKRKPSPNELKLGKKLQPRGPGGQFRKRKKAA